MVAVKVEVDPKERFDPNGSVPAHSLPAELLASIFEDASGVLQHKPLLPRKENGAEVTISHVCAHWRHVALNSSALWSRIDLDDSSRKMLERAHIYLERSGSNLIDVAYVGSVYLVFGMYFVPHIHRWRRLFVASVKPLFWEGFKEAMQHTSAPELEYIRLDSGSVRGSDGANYRSEDPTFIFRGGADRLKVVSLRGEDVAFLVNNVQGLVKVHFHERDPYGADVRMIDWVSNLHRMLNGLQALERLVLHGYVLDIFLGNMQLALDLPNLRVLEHSSRWGSKIFLSIIQHLNSPQLERVTWRSINSIFPENLLALDIRRTSFHSVKFLTIVMGTGVPTNMWEYLQFTFPNITELVSQHDRLHDLWTWPGSTGSWPHLQTLAVTRGRPLAADFKHLKRLLVWMQSQGVLINHIKWPVDIKTQRKRFVQLEIDNIEIWDAAEELRLMDDCEWYESCDTVISW